MKKLLFGTPISEVVPSIGLLLFRVVFGGFMLIGHGWGKLMAFQDKAATFPDPLGIGSELSMGFAVFAEVICSLFVMLGFATRFAVIPLIFTMGVAALLVHGADPLFMSGAGGAKEPALIYLMAFTLLCFTGPGGLSVDHYLDNK